MAEPLKKEADKAEELQPPFVKIYMVNDLPHISTNISDASKIIVLLEHVKGYVMDQIFKPEKKHIIPGNGFVNGLRKRFG